MHAKINAEEAPLTSSIESDHNYDKVLRKMIVKWEPRKKAKSIFSAFPVHLVHSHPRFLCQHA